MAKQETRKTDETKGLLEAFQLLLKFSLKDMELYSKVAKIVSVDDATALCEVSFFDDEPNLTDVKIQQVQQTAGLYIKPQVNSIVIITFTGPNNAFISITSEVDEIIFRGGFNDGMVKVNDLVTKLNNLESEVNKITNLLKTWVVVPSDGGLALKTAATALFLSPLTPTVKANLENPLFKH